MARRQAGLQENSLDECLQLDLPLKQFAKVIKVENMNSYEAPSCTPTKLPTAPASDKPSTKMVPEDASLTEQQWARETLLKSILHQLVETEVYDGTNEEVVLLILCQLASLTYFFNLLFNF